MRRVSEWLALARTVGALRFLVDGSFVTAKPEPGDVDAVCWLPEDFGDRYRVGDPAAGRLYQMLATRYPVELFGVSTEEDYEDWCEFFGRTRESDRQRKGLVEVLL